MADASNMADLFHLPLSSQGYAKFQQLSAIIADTPLQKGNDTWSYIWRSNMFASSKAYLSLTGMFIWLTNGYGIVVASQNENSFSGSYLKID